MALVLFCEVVAMGTHVSSDWVRWLFATGIRRLDV